MDRRLKAFTPARIAASFLLGILFVCSSAAQERVIAVGDVHGSFPQFVGILQQVGLLDANHHWAGGAAVLVQVGDVPDRGTRTRECLDLLMALEQEAPRQNGRVIPLLGNHEVMVMVGDFRYVNREDYPHFADERSNARREEAYREFRAFVDANPRRRQAFGADDAAGRQKWMEGHPLGFFELRDAFGPEGVYGRWLRQHDAVAQIGGEIFVHGGLSPQFHFRNFRELNERARSELRRYDALWQSLSQKGIIWRYMQFREAVAEVRAALKSSDETDSDPRAAQALGDMREFANIGDWAISSPDGPLWYRGYAQEPTERLQSFVEKTLRRFEAQRIVVGHTIVDSQRITTGLHNRVLFIETEMILEGRGGRTSALEIRNETFTAYYSNGERRLLLAGEGLGTPSSVGAGSAHGSQNP
ncbi:MAG: metallophosphoesterase [Acidobacteriia bacterium]|nr:metallophosphoesterase [Terriglobia bacterium]